jgi:hypothetical protein
VYLPTPRAAALVQRCGPRRSAVPLRYRLSVRQAAPLRYNATVRSTTPPDPPTLDTDTPWRYVVNDYASRVLLITTVLFIGGALLALLLGAIAAISGTRWLDVPLALTSLVFCLSMPILIVAVIVLHFTEPRPFHYADRRLLATFAAVRAGDPQARARLLRWAREHLLVVRAAFRQHADLALVHGLIPALHAPDLDDRQAAQALLDTDQSALLAALLPFLEGRRRAGFLKDHIRRRAPASAAFISASVLDPLRSWDGPPQPPPDPNLLYALLTHWPELANDDDLRRALAMPDFVREASWLTGRGELKTARQPLAFSSVRARAEAELGKRAATNSQGT